MRKIARNVIFFFLESSSCLRKMAAEAENFGMLAPGRRVTLLVAYALFILVNVVSQAGMFGLPTNGDISQDYPTPITPAPWTFSIWGVIFLHQGGGVVYAFLGPGGETGTATALGRVSVWWMCAWAASSLWQGLFLIQTPAGMIVSAIALIGIATFANVASAIAKTTSRHSRQQVVFIALPSSMYAGWTTLASAVGVLVVGSSLHASHSVMLGLSFGALAVVMAVVLYQIFGNKDELFAVPIVWGLIGVASGTSDVSIRIFANVGAVLILFCGIVRKAIHLWELKKAKEIVEGLGSAAEPFLPITAPKP